MPKRKTVGLEDGGQSDALFGAVQPRRAAKLP